MGLGKTYSTKYLLDSNNSSGVAGQVLSTTSTGIDWVNANTVPGAGLWIESGNNIYNSNSGNVGIGTTSPNHKLQVEGGSAESIINLTTTGYANGLDIIEGTDGHAAIWLRENSYMHFATNSVERMRITNGGNVGIGTTSPGRKLTVQGPDNGTMQLRLMGTASQTSYWEIGRESASTGQFRFIASRNGTVITPMVIDDQTGNVGIGTSSPNVLGFLETSLNIAAGSSSSTTLQQAGLVISGSSDAGDGDDFSYLSFTNYQSTLSSDRVAEIRIKKAGSNVDTGQFHFYTANGTALNESMVLSESGNLKLSQYGAGTLVSDASGNITVSSGGGAGGPYLPLAGGTLTGNLTGTTISLTGGITANTFRTNAGNTDYNLLTRDSTGNTLFVQAAQSNTNQPIAKFSYGSATVNAGTAVLQVSKDNSHFVNCSVGVGTTSPQVNLHSNVSRASGAFTTQGKIYALEVSNSDTTAGNAVGINFGHGGYHFTNFIASVRTGTGANPKGDLVFGGRPSDNVTFVERMRILANGNVGIGTTSPAAGLQVAKGSTTIPAAGASTASAVFGNSTSDDNYGVAIGANSSGVGYISSQRTDGNATTYNLAVQPNGGNVGIGTTSPDSKLDVNGGATLSTGVPLRMRTNATLLDSTEFRTGNGEFKMYSGRVSSSHQSFVFATGDNYTSGSTRMVILGTNGNVGIGVTGPTQKLHVAGTGLFTGNVTIGTGVIKTSIGGDIAITQGNIGLRINDAASAISPTTASANNDNAVDLGVSNIRFKDGYFSGTVTAADFVGGSGAFLPLTAGSTKKLTDTLYIQGTNSTNAESVLLRGVSSNDGDFLGSIRTANAGGYDQEMRFYTSDANGTTNENLVLTLDASKDATFAGTLAVQGTGDSYFTGSVGIGTTSPDAKLEVAGGLTGIILSNLGNSSAYDAVIMTYSGYNSGVPEFIFQPKTAPGSGNVNSYFRFKTQGSIGKNIANVTVDGKVGIGVTAPATKLHVQGAANDGLAIMGVGTTATRGFLGLDASNHGQMQVVSSASGGGALIKSIGVSYLNGGNVGIGTTGPSSKLTIADTAFTTAYNSIKGLFFDNSNISSGDENFGAGIEFGKLSNGGNLYKKAAIIPVQSGSDSDQMGISFFVSNTVSQASPVIEAMRVDYGGNVGIGTTSPDQELHVAGTVKWEGVGTSGLLSGGETYVSVSQSVNSYDLRLGYDTGDFTIKGDGKIGIGLTNPSSKLTVSSPLSTNGVSVDFQIDGGSGFGMRNLQVEIPDFGNGIRVISPTSASSDNTAMSFYQTTSQVGTISMTASATSFNTTSDYRLKENKEDISDAIERVKKLKPVKFNWIKEPNELKVDGFYAHELADVVPEAVTGKKDALDHEGNPAYQAIDQSKIVPLLAAALQQAIDKIEQLEIRIQTIENN